MNKAERIWTEYSRLMLWIARGFFGESPDAEDAVSEAVEKILSHLELFGEVPSPASRALCSVITKNVCRDILRRRRAGKNPESESLDELLSEREEEGELPAAPSAEEVWFSARTVAGVKDLIGQLPEAYADILRLTYAAGLAPREIARLTGITEGNARIRLFRARAALEKLMRKEGLL